ncbi:mitochondrial F1F0 ATP synthase subunit F (Atp17), putative [Talaromyces stipitatus ATCC 10500]|uniref:Mitochondrial F1F0 ATP synthase subunit F (Atp17), putative n=1 Tax=Talaromyces stipitatus (strain ATCC 10500 / CBS 375.48 / QM 6759 / NRRL 1006) TaxID=441959 RepID=B8M2R2_TALSN|nr:mitochondrial F1F0 ATP synthase subunit F (Atp17), putative [Talaromyces stipitatus ATCC 10500]EED21973.1 mitochondrial F1F0 ATP synthase subunit F (Atp17), putative [Talaromyces stipitatus ATCC 10500]
MSYITRRALSTLIPPKAIGAAQDAARMERVVGFYAGLPRGPAPAPKPSGFLERYQARYFNGKNASGMPLVHVIGTMLVVGYSMEYYFHLRKFASIPYFRPLGI